MPLQSHNVDKLFRLLTYLHIELRFNQAEEGPEYYIENRMRIIEISLSPRLYLRKTGLREMHAREICHEIGHLLIAPKSRRDKPNYGIPSQSIGETYWDRDDARASQIAYELAQRFGVVYSWNGTMQERPEEELAWWRAKGRELVNKNWNKAMGHFNPKHIKDWAVYGN